MPPGTRWSAGAIIHGKYRLVAPLGEGAAGVVWRARHVELPRGCAIKLLKPELATGEMLVRFKREARLASSLRHPNVIDVFDFGVEQGTPFLVMEELDGATLADRMAHVECPVEMAVEIARQVLDGLDAAHEQNIVHRDLKPENIFLARVQRSVIVKLLDFGIASVVEGDENAPRLTKAGTFWGTLHYASPEQFRGARVGPVSDIYALGVVLYELLSGAWPYGDRQLSANELCLAVCGGELVPLDRVRPDLPAPLVAVVHRALERNPNRRFASARDMSNALEAAMAPGESRFAHAPVEPPTARPGGGTRSRAVRAEPPSAHAAMSNERLPDPTSAGGPSPASAKARGTRAWLAPLLVIAAVAAALLVLVPAATLYFAAGRVTADLTADAERRAGAARTSAESETARLASEARIAETLARAEAAAERARLETELEQLQRSAAAPPPRSAPIVLAQFRDRGIDNWPGIVVEADGERRHVVFLDGTEDWAEASGLLPDGLLPGASVHAHLAGERVDVTVVQRVGYAVLVRGDSGGRAWTSLAQISAPWRFVAPTLGQQTSAARSAPAGALQLQTARRNGSTSAGSAVLAPFGGSDAPLYPGVVVAEHGDELDIVFADGTMRTISRQLVTADTIESGSAIEVSQGYDWNRARVLERIGDALRVNFDDGSEAWTTLARVLTRTLRRPVAEPALVSATAVREWYCVCATEAVRDVPIAITTCRPTRSDCEQVEDRARSAGWSFISLDRECTAVSGAHPGDSIGTVAEWVPSARAGGWQLRGRCAL